VLGQQYKANMPNIADRFAAFRTATGQDSDMSQLVSVTVKDADGTPVVLTMMQDQWLTFLAGFQPM